MQADVSKDLSLAITFLDAGNSAKARGILQDVLEKAPTLMPARRLMMRILANGENVDELRDFALETQRMDIKEPSSHFYLCFAALQEGAVKHAVLKLADIKNHCPEAKQEIGMMEVMIEKILPNTKVGYGWIANYLQRAGIDEQAAENMHRSKSGFSARRDAVSKVLAELDKGECDVDALVFAAHIATDLNDYDSFKTLRQAAMAADPTNPKVRKLFSSHDLKPVSLADY